MLVLVLVLALVLVLLLILVVVLVLILVLALVLCLDALGTPRCGSGAADRRARLFICHFIIAAHKVRGARNG